MSSARLRAAFPAIYALPIVVALAVPAGACGSKKDKCKDAFDKSAIATTVAVFGERLTVEKCVKFWSDSQIECVASAVTGFELADCFKP